MKVIVKIDVCLAGKHTQANKQIIYVSELILTSNNL